LSDDVPTPQPPYGTLAPHRLDSAILATTCRLPDNWLGLRLAIALRRITTMRLSGDDGLDVERFGLKIRLHPRRNGCEKGLLFTPQMYEIPECAALTAEIERTRAAGRPFVFVDIGANVGLFSLFVASRIGRAGIILAIEPDTENLRRLRFNIAANPGVPIRVIATALGERTGTVALDVNWRDRGGTRTRFLEGDQHASDANARSSGEPLAACRTLLQVLTEQAISAVDAMKIDVEGAENRILSPFFRDALQSLWPKLIIIEGTGDLRGVAPYSTMIALGYREMARTNDNVMMRR
jgi:FkbM family methyltransferase